MIPLKKQSGVALLEVLIAFVIVTVSVVALYQLQNKYLRNEITTSARLTALHIAEGKLDDLRTFGSLSVSAGVPSYDQIADNVGGSIASGAVSSANANVGNFVYNLGWDVTDNNGTKDVVITVSWDGGEERVTLNGSIARVEKVNEDRLANTGKSGNEKPIVTYQPDEQDVAPTVIPIVLGDSGSIKATTRPLPDIGKNGSNTFVQFDSVTYNSSSNTQALDDYVTLSCDCSYITNDKASTPATPYVTDNDLLYWQAGLPSSSSKKRGKSTKSTLCNVCCENHFDVEGSPSFDEVYNHLNPVAEKYRIVKSGSNYSYASASGGIDSPYIDSCRLMRIDGYYEPMPDWNLVKLVVIDSYFLDKTNPKYAANLENYQNYIAYVVKEYALWLHGNVNDDPLNITNTSPVLSILSFNEWLSNGGNSVNTSGDLTLNISMEANKTKQLISRGIFVDILSQDLMSESLGLFAEDGSISADYLSKIPFYDVNMTKLTRWHPNNNSDSTDDTSQISVTSAPMSDLNSSDEYYGVYSRGSMTTGSTVKDTPVTVTAEAFPGNSSIAAYQPDAKKAEMSVGNSTYDQAIVSGSLAVTVKGTPRYRTRGYIYCFETANKTCDASVFDAIKDDNSQCDIISQKLTGKVDYYIYQCATDAEKEVTVSFSSPSSAYYSPTSISRTATTSLAVTHGGCAVFYNNSMITAPAITCPLPTP